MKKIQIFLIGLVAIIGIVVAVLFIDPFNWHLRDRSGGEYDAALTAIPADSLAYVGVNLLQYDADAWTAMRGEVMDDGGIMTELDDVIFDETGLHFADEVQAWIGQYAGVAILSFPADMNDSDFLIIAEVRDEKAASAFLENLEAGWSERQNVIAQERDGIIYFEEFAFVINGRLLLIGSSLNAVERGITAINGKSLADEADYAKAIAALPAERLLTGYLSADSLPTITPLLLSDGFMGATAGDLLPATMGITAVSLNSSDDGIQIDTITLYDESKMSHDEKVALTAVGHSNAAAILPADTLVYVAGQSIATSWPPMRQRLATAIGEADFEESMQLFGDDFGLNPDTELFPLLTGETAVALLDGMIPIAVLESEGMDEVKTAVFQFNDTVTESGLGKIGEVDGVYAFSTFLVPDLAFSYTLSDNALLFSNDSAMLATLPAASTLADTPRYREAMAAFTDREMGLYIHLPALLRASGSEQEMGDLPFIPMIAGGTAVFPAAIHHRLIIFVDETAE